MKRLLLGVAVLGLASCGGKYEEPGSASAGAPDRTPNASVPAGGGSGGVGGISHDGPLPTHDLGTCVPGFDQAQNPGRACPWVTEAGQCFATKDAACACVCPTDHVSVCYSDFDSPDVSTLTHCK